MAWLLNGGTKNDKQAEVEWLQRIDLEFLESVGGNTGTKVTTPTESENAGLQETTPTGSTVTAGPDTGGSLVDPEEGKTLIATNATENAQFYYQLNDSTGEIRYLFGIESGMKANTKYRLEWSISDSINSVYYGIQLMYQIPGLEYPHGLVGDNLYSNSWEFTTDATAEQYLYFYVAQGDESADLSRDIIGRPDTVVINSGFIPIQIPIKVKRKIIPVDHTVPFPDISGIMLIIAIPFD